MEKLSKKQIKAIARIHSAILLSYANTEMFDDECKISETQKEQIVQEINIIADKMSKEDPLNIGNTEDIIKYVKDNF